MNVLKLIIVISFFQVAQANPLIFMNFTRTSEKFNMKFYTEIAVGSKIMFKKKINVSGTLLNLKSIELTHNGLVMTFADEPEFQIFINSYITEDSRYLVNRTREGVRLRIVSTDTEVIDREFENLVDAYSRFLYNDRILRARQNEIIGILNEHILSKGKILPKLYTESTKPIVFVIPSEMEISFNFDANFNNYLNTLENVSFVQHDKKFISLSLSGNYQEMAQSLEDLVAGYKSYLNKKTFIKINR